MALKLKLMHLINSLDKFSFYIFYNSKLTNNIQHILVFSRL